MSDLDAARLIRVGVVQAAPVFLDRDGTTDRACELIAEAGREGIDVLGFPEGFIPTHPDWYHYLPASSAKSFEFARRLFNNSVEIPSPTTDRLADAASRARVNVVIGLCERTPEPELTLYNTQLFIAADGRLLGKHQKIMPTLAERVVHARGAGDGLRAFATPVARVSGLICGENSNPLAIMALAADRPDIHVASWPSPVSRDEGGMTDLIRVASQSLAYATGSFVLSSQAVVSESIVSELAQSEEDRRFLTGQIGRGSSLIAAPNREIVAGPRTVRGRGSSAPRSTCSSSCTRVTSTTSPATTTALTSSRSASSADRGPLVQPWDRQEPLVVSAAGDRLDAARRNGGRAAGNHQGTERDEAPSARD